MGDIPSEMGNSTKEVSGRQHDSLATLRAYMGDALARNDTFENDEQTEDHVIDPSTLSGTEWIDKTTKVQWEWPMIEEQNDMHRALHGISNVLGRGPLGDPFENSDMSELAGLCKQWADYAEYVLILPILTTGLRAKEIYGSWIYSNELCSCESTLVYGSCIP